MKGARRGGFTIVEVALVATFLGIMAGIAMPNLTKAIQRAHAARIVSVVPSIELAVATHVEDTGLLPATAAWNTLPPDLVPYLPENMEFFYEHLEYRLVTNQNNGRVRFKVRYPAGDPIGEALKRFERSGEVTWTSTKTTFILDPE